MRKPNYEADIYDKRLNPREPNESYVKCVDCGCDIHEGEEAYNIWGDIYCEEHAKEWLEQQKFVVTWEEAYE